MNSHGIRTLHNELDPVAAQGRRASRLGAVVLAAILAGTGARVPTAQDLKPEQVAPFRVRSEVVELDVSVLGEDGRPVSGLRAADFTVLEGGVPQPVVAFAPVEAPTWTDSEPAWMREVAPDVVTNRSDARRAIVIIFDDFGIRWDPGIAHTAKAIATRTIDELGPSDLAAVVYTFERRKGQEFTVDRGRLRAAIDRFVPSGLAPQPQGRFDASAPGRGLMLPSLQSGTPSGACPDMSCVLSALRNTAQILAAWRSIRKTIVLITQGQPFKDRNLDQVPDEFRETVAALQQANVTVYEFDPRGLESERKDTNLGLFADNLTGGRMITSTNAPSDFVPQVFRESSSYYLIGFQPTNVRRDGRFRRVEVQVHRRGVKVLARAGYYAPTEPPEKPATQSTTDRALAGGLPAGDLPMALTVAPFATS